jgi:hypothetical protein
VLQRTRFGISRAVYGGADRVQYSIDVVGDVVVPKTDNAVALVIEPSRAFIVVRLFQGISMLRAIHLDDKARRHACKICKIRADGYLSPEMRALRFQSPKLPP